MPEQLESVSTQPECCARPLRPLAERIWLRDPVRAQSVFELLDVHLPVEFVDHVRTGARIARQHKHIHPGTEHLRDVKMPEAVGIALLATMVSFEVGSRQQRIQTVVERGQPPSIRRRKYRIFILRPFAVVKCARSANSELTRRRLKS